MSDPNLHWDGQKWLRWDGDEWAPAPDLPPPAVSKSSGAPIALAILGMAVAVFILAGVAGAAIWLLNRDSGEAQVSSPIIVATVPIGTAEDPFTDSVGTDLTFTPVTTKQPRSVPGGKPGLYGGTLEMGTCDRAKLIRFLEANPDKAAAWAAVLGIEPTKIRSFINRLTPMLLRRDTYVINHGYANGVATPMPSVLQAGTAVLVGRYGLPVVRCYCGNPLTPATPASDVTFQGPSWPTWDPQSITLVTKNTRIIDDFVLVDVVTGEQFIRPVSSDGSQDRTEPEVPESTQSNPVPQASQFDADYAVVSGFLTAVSQGRYADADAFTTGDFISSQSLAPGWGTLMDYRILGAEPAGDSVAVTVEEAWNGGSRTSTYFVVAWTGSKKIADANLPDTGGSSEEYYEDEFQQYPDMYPEGEAVG